jgi:hypothetical protein
MESVKHQPNPRLFRDLVTAFTFLRETDHPLTNSARDRTVIKESNVERVVKHYTNLNIRLSSGSAGARAYVSPPRLDKNHPFNTPERRALSDNSDAVLAIRRAKGRVQGSIDLDKGRVEGVYAELINDVFVSSEIIQGDFFTVEEATALFLHELGHLMTYYEYLGRVYTLNHVLGDLVRGYAKSTSIKERVELLSVTRDALDLTELDVDAASSITDTETVQMLIVSEVVNEPSSATNTRIYDYRTSEALADQYVSRMGAGRHLATGMDRLFRLAGTNSYYSDRKFLMIEAVKILLIAKWFVGFFVLAALTASLVSPDLKYDPIGQRLKRIRQDIVEAMKNPRLDKDYRKRLQEDADVLADLLSNVKDRETIIGYLWKRLYPPNIKQMNRVKMMQDLEALANNELFVKANLLTVKA